MTCLNNVLQLISLRSPGLSKTSKINKRRKRNTNVHIIPTLARSLKFCSCTARVSLSCFLILAILMCMIQEMAITPAAHFRRLYSRYWERSRYLRHDDWIWVAATCEPLGPMNRLPWNYHGMGLKVQFGLIQCRERKTKKGWNQVAGRNSTNKAWESKFKTTIQHIYSHWNIACGLSWLVYFGTDIGQRDARRCPVIGGVTHCRYHCTENIFPLDLVC